MPGRLEKQRLYQREYRERMKKAKAPGRDDIARARLHFAITENLRLGRKEEVEKIMDYLVDQLTAQGFAPRATEQALDALVTKYARGWGFQRKVHLRPWVDDGDVDGSQGDRIGESHRHREDA